MVSDAGLMSAGREGPGVRLIEAFCGDAVVSSSFAEDVPLDVENRPREVTCLRCWSTTPTGGAGRAILLCLTLFDLRIIVNLLHIDLYLLFPLSGLL